MSELTPLKHVACLKTQVIDPSPRPLIALEHLQSGTGALRPDAPEDPVAPTPGVADVAPGDVLFGKLRPYLAKSWVADRRVRASTELLCLHPLPGIDSRWLGYLVNSGPFIDWAVATSDGAKMPRTSWERMNAFRIAVPSTARQCAIIDYLDRETTRIDEFVDAKKRLAALVQERFHAAIFHEITGGDTTASDRKGSGLEWVESIPVHWATPPVTANFEVHLGKMLNPAASAGVDHRPYLRNINVQWDRLDLDDVATMHFGLNDRRIYALRAGDLLVCEGGEVGRAAIWHDELRECYFQKALHRLRPKGKANPRYLLYCLWGAANHGVFAVEGNLSTIVHLTREQLMAHRFPWPPAQRQREI